MLLYMQMWLSKIAYTYRWMKAQFIPVGVASESFSKN